jgi:hypothetical protein
MSSRKQPRKSASRSASLTVPELEHSKTTVLNMPASAVMFVPVTPLLDARTPTRKRS